MKIGTQLVVFGLRRSGNHAIINWILPQIQGDFAYYNDVWPNNPYQLEPKERRGDSCKIDVSLISFEDYNLHIFKSLFKNKNGPEVGQSINILILRDPFNWYASRLKSQMESPAHYSGLNIRQLYLQYLKEFRGETNLLGDPTVVISYNRWKTSIAYRRSISDKLGLQFTDQGLDKVTGEGGGSSFDGMSRKGQDLETDKRYRHYLKDLRYLSLFSNAELLEFAGMEFSIPDELSYLVDKVKKKNTDHIDKMALKYVPKLTQFMRRCYLSTTKGLRGEK